MECAGLFIRGARSCSSQQAFTDSGNCATANQQAFPGCGPYAWVWVYSESFIFIDVTLTFGPRSP
jgi:hypothetical protein